MLAILTSRKVAVGSPADRGSSSASVTSGVAGSTGGPPSALLDPWATKLDATCAVTTTRVSWLRQCAGWLAHLDADSDTPAASLRPAADWPDRAIIAAAARVAAVIDRIAADVDELARARPAWTWTPPRCCPTGGQERRRRLAEPDLQFRAFCRPPGADRPLPQPRNWRGPGTPGWPSGTSAARLANDPPTPETGPAPQPVRIRHVPPRRDAAHRHTMIMHLPGGDATGTFA